MERKTRGWQRRTERHAGVDRHQSDAAASCRPFGDNNRFGALRNCYLGGRNSLLIQPDVLSDLSGSAGSHFSQCNVRRPLPPGGDAGIRIVPHFGQVARSA
jgi:hypothetical protein